MAEPPTAPPERPQVAKPRFQIISRGAARRLGILSGVVLVLGLWAYWSMIVMPGRSWSGPLPPLTEPQTALSARLRTDIETLAATIGPRSPMQHRGMGRAAEHIISRLRESGYERIEEVPVPAGAQTPNLIVELPGTAHADEIIVVGAHYDTFYGTPGADDNASGVAAVLALAAEFVGKPAHRTIRFVLFVNEEPPAFWTRDMGSWVYARQCKARGDRIVAMLSLESIGYYSDAPGSQRYPAPLNALYPTTGNFIAFVGNYGSRSLVRRCISQFRTHAKMPSQGAALPGVLPGVGWSDHWSFWQEGYRAIMVTCTANYRNPHYHLPGDTPAIIDYDRTARVVDGLIPVLRDLASAQ